MIQPYKPSNFRTFCYCCAFVWFKRWNQDISGFSILWMKLTKEIDPEIQPIYGKKPSKRLILLIFGFWNFMTTIMNLFILLINVL